jgi:hypothetical protein
MSQQLYSTLLVLGELLSNALDRVDELEKKVDSQNGRQMLIEQALGWYPAEM